MDRPLFTAARFARALGRDKRGVLRMLRKVSAQGKTLVPGGQMADAWCVESLPENYRADLARRAKLKGCRDANHLLAEGLSRWKPEIPLAELRQVHIAKAARVKRALARALALHASPFSSIGEVRRAAFEDYQKEFGLVSERTVRRIWDRVIDRDNGEENFDDLALYLDEQLSREKEPLSVSPSLLSAEELSIVQYLRAVVNPHAPTVHETDLIWCAVCESMQRQMEAGMPAKKARRTVLTLLSESAVCLSKNGATLKILLKRKFARFLECAGDFSSMADQRSEKSGWKRRLELSEADRQLIIGHAARNKGGRLAPALRELRTDGVLSPELEMHHVSNPSRKSYVPESLRKQIQPDVRRLKNMVRGPRTHRLNGAYLNRDYSSMAAGDWYQADDVTLPAYFWEETESGPVLMRGQFLVMIDVRTDFILGFLLIPKRNYDSLSIRSLITVCAAKHGLPRRGFYFENGSWKTSKIIAGSRSAVPFDHADRGLRSLGMELCHARLPRAKVIERTIGQLQNRMEGLPGYVGRDERHDVHERAKQAMLDVEAGRRPINECFFSKSQYCEQLAKIIDDHNTEPQEGVRLNGLTPAEAWENLQGTKPRQGFSNQWRYVLARDVRKIKVGRNGITLRYGKKAFVYHDAETGRRVGEEVLAWFDPMFPEVLACTNLDRKNLFSVEQAKEVPAMDAPEDLLNEEMAKIEAHQEYGKTLYWTSQNALKERHYIGTVADAETVQMGAEIDLHSQRIATRNEEQAQRTRANRAIIEKEGLPKELLSMAGRASPDAMDDVRKLLAEPTPEELSP